MWALLYPRLSLLKNASQTGDEDQVTDRHFKFFVGVCVVQILCGLGLAWGGTARQQWGGFLIAGVGALEIAIFGWSRWRNSN